MKTVVIQAASGRHASLLRLAEPWHRAYCERHGFEYIVRYGPLQRKYRAVWDKLIVLIEVLRSCAPGTLVIWMDADVLIELMEESIAAALPPGFDVGMVRSLVGELNAGVIWMVASQRTLAWLERVQELGPLDGGFLQEQTRMNREFSTFGLKVAEVAPRFNAYRWAAAQIVEPAVIRAWHAHPLPYRFHRMQSALALICQHCPVSKEVCAHVERSSFGG